jgi:hypothetical protein
MKNRRALPDGPASNGVARKNDYRQDESAIEMTSGVILGGRRRPAGNRDELARDVSSVRRNNNFVTTGILSGRLNEGGLPYPDLFMTAWRAAGR